MSAGKIVLGIFGAILTIVAMGLVIGGAGLLWAQIAEQDDDGFFTSPAVELSTETYALTSTDIDLGARPGDWLPSGRLAEVRLKVTTPEATPVFVGIGPEDEVDAYLAGVGSAEVTRIGPDAGKVEYRTSEGGAPPAPPASQTFWVASVEGTGDQDLNWDLERGEWVVVVMNADGAPGVAVEAAAGARAEWFVPISAGLLVSGLALAAAAAVLLVVATRSVGEAATVAAPAMAIAGFGHYPVRVEGDLDPNLSRWQWLVKWFLAVPHFIVLGFLWAVFAILTVVAFFAILVTGRYPRGIFDFNVGVFRWSWRVAYYCYGVLGTDRYPPFTLADADYPARLDIAYPEQLSRGLVLVKWWLLAIPHYIIVGLFTSGLVWWTTELDLAGDPVLQVGGGLVGILVLVAGVMLLVTGRYPQAIFDLVMGFQRWVFRVGAYAALMRDEYPPFRLDTGGTEPGVNPAEPEGPSDRGPEGAEVGVTAGRR